MQIQNTPSLHAVLLGGASGPSHCERVYSGGKRNRQTGGADQRKVSYSCDVGKQLHHLFKEKERANIGELTLRQLLPRQVSLVEWSFFPSSHHLPHCFPVRWTKGIAFKSRRLRIGTANLYPMPGIAVERCGWLYLDLAEIQPGWNWLILWSLNTEEEVNATKRQMRSRNP